jgi:hypothetical protein
MPGAGVQIVMDRVGGSVVSALGHGGHWRLSCSTS